MTPEVGESLTMLEWGNAHLIVHISTAEDDAPRIIGLTLPGDPTPDIRRSALPLVDIALVGEGRNGTSGKRHVDGAAAHRLRVVDQRIGSGVIPGEVAGRGCPAGPWMQLVMKDPVTGLEAMPLFHFPATDTYCGSRPPSPQHAPLWWWSTSPRSPWVGSRLVRDGKLKQQYGTRRTPGAENFAGCAQPPPNEDCLMSA